MTEIDDKLLKDFFCEHKEEIADNGFTKRVMRQLPIRNKILSTLLSTCCTIVALIIFFVFDGLQAIAGTLQNVMITMVQNGAENLDIRSLLIASAVLLIFGVRKIYTME